MDSFIEALYGRSEETIPEEYDWFAPLLGDWEFDYKDKCTILLMSEEKKISSTLNRADIR